MYKNYLFEVHGSIYYFNVLNQMLHNLPFITTHIIQNQNL